MKINDILVITRWVLTAMRVCEDALRYKMILFGRGRSYWSWWGNLNPAVDYLLRFSGGTSGVLHWCDFILSHSMITATFASILCPCQPHCSAFGRGTSIELCGLLRKTGAKIPAGPFRKSDARQWSGHFGTDWAHSAAQLRRLMKIKSWELFCSCLCDWLENVVIYTVSLAHMW